ncbi:MAG TPA: hypothetical protein VJ965_06720 [Anaerolineales bacterium]|nr:hypothetical protein [Anaerolineales bacterium]
MSKAIDDLQYVEYCVGELEHYLLSKELFWPVLIHPALENRGFPKMTLGNVRLAMQRLEGLWQGRRLEPAEESTYQQLKDQLDTIQQKWRVAWEEKAAHEYHSRLKQWTDLLNEIFQNREKQADYYPADVRLRVLLALLEEDVPTEQRPEIEPVDAHLRAIFQRGPFVWETEYEPGFPEDRFWFLYGGILTE